MCVVTTDDKYKNTTLHANGQLVLIPPPLPHFDVRSHVHLTGQLRERELCRALVVKFLPNRQVKCPYPREYS